MGFSDFIAQWVLLIVPQPCFDEFFINYNFFDADCIKLVISKCLGYGIVAGSLLVKVPQITKILNASSAEGISIISTSLELAAIGANLAYSFANSFPFSTYGDAFFLLIQTLLIGFLVLHYGGSTVNAIIYSLVALGIQGFLMSPLAPMWLLYSLQGSVIANITLARMIQAYKNYSNQSTGQLSAVTLGLLLFGALARVFTSLQETGDVMLIVTYIVATTCNAILAFQMVYYWNSTTQALKKQE